MELSRKRAKTLGNAGLMGLAAASCATCCAPLVGSLLATLLVSSGIAGLAAVEQYALAAAALLAAGGGALLTLPLLRRRRRPKEGCAIPAAPGGQP